MKFIQDNNIIGASETIKTHKLTQKLDQMTKYEIIGRQGQNNIAIVNLVHCLMCFLLNYLSEEDPIHVYD